MVTGLTEIPTDALRSLLRLVYKGEVEIPLTITQITRTGLQYCAGDLLASLRTLDKAGVMAVLTVVIAEREAVARRPSAAPRELGGADNAFSGDKT